MFVPDRIKIPSPDFVNAVDPSITPPYVKVVPLSTLTVPPPVLHVIPLLVFRVKDAVVCKVPPFKIKRSASKVSGLPRLLSAATEMVPSSIIILPV